MRTTVDIDPHLLKRLRSAAHRRGVTFKELLTAVLRRGLEDRTAGTRRRYKCPAHALGVPAAPVNLDKALAVAAGLEDEETARELALRK